MDSGERGHAHLDLPGVCIPWIALQPGWGGHGGEGRARRRLQPRMPSARKKPSALGNSGTARALPPEIREQRFATPQIQEQLSPRCPEQREAPPTRDLWLGDGKTELGMGFLGQPRGGITEFRGGLGWEPQNEHRDGFHREGDAEHGGSSGCSQVPAGFRSPNPARGCPNPNNSRRRIHHLLTPNPSGLPELLQPLPKPTLIPFFPLTNRDSPAAALRKSTAREQPPDLRRGKKSRREAGKMIPAPVTDSWSSGKAGGMRCSLEIVYP